MVWGDFDATVAIPSRRGAVCAEVFDSSVGTRRLRKVSMKRVSRCVIVQCAMTWFYDSTKDGALNGLHTPALSDRPSIKAVANP